MVIMTKPLIIRVMTDKTISQLQQQMDSFLSANSDEVTAENLIALSSQWVSVSRNKKAIECLEEVSKILTPLPDFELTLARTYLKTAHLYRKLGKNKLAGSSYNSALTTYKKVYTSDHLEFASMFFTLGSFMDQIMKLNQAETYYKHALDMITRLEGPKHTSYAQISTKLLEIQNKIKLYRK
jgi:tetratricopeptide (TPR) repeat protein